VSRYYTRLFLWLSLSNQLVASLLLAVTVMAACSQSSEQNVKTVKLERVLICVWGGQLSIARQSMQDVVLYCVWCIVC